RSCRAISATYILQTSHTQRPLSLSHLMPLLISRLILHNCPMASSTSISGHPSLPYRAGLPAYSSPAGASSGMYYHRFLFWTAKTDIDSTSSKNGD
ncbi:hypothetical protein M378DRAFT_172440, partial [Amanita muscaria Koide BX008]